MPVSRPTDEFTVGSFAGPQIAGWLPNESLFSLCSRHHVLAANIKASVTCQQLFRHPRIGSAHDFPARINQFASCTEGRFGTASDIIQRRTIFPFYLRFRSPASSANLMAAAASDSPGPLKAELGLLSSRFGASHPLKACAQCMLDDEKEHHVAYWHVEHQLPGVWICLQHKTSLLRSQLKSTGAERFGWCLPATAQLVPSTLEPLSPSGIALLHSLAVGAQSIWSLPADFELSADCLTRLYLTAMMRQGIASTEGRIHHLTLGRTIMDITSPIAGMREFDCLPQSFKEGATQFARMVSVSRIPSHPLRHLILIQALFGGWDAMWSEYQASWVSQNRLVILQQPEYPELQPVSVKAGICASKRLQLLDDLAKGGESMASLARRHQLACGTVMAWAAAAGIPSRRRPKLLTPIKREQLVRALQQGADKSTIAQSLSISVQTVTNTLRTEVGLRDRWASTRFELAKQSSRAAWEKTADSVSMPTPKMMRSLQPAVFAWLYRNDRAWLEAFSDRIPRVLKSNYRCIDWDQRDRDLSQAIRVAALKWHEENAFRKPTIAVLCQIIPELKGRLSSLDQMPLCRTVLSEISGRRRKKAA